MNNIQRLTVYLGSSGRCRPVFKDTARRLGEMIGENDKSLVYGGMDSGLMGIVATSALDCGARVTGIIPKTLKDSERIHPHLSETILVPDLWERKLKMFKRADAIVALPGGFGTIDEVLEVFYWADIESHIKPIILVNTEQYWDEFITYLQDLPDLHKDLLIVVDRVEDVFDALASWSPPTREIKEERFPNFEDIILLDTEEPMIFAEATVKDSYCLATALGLKQLDKHHRGLGILNDKGQFDALLRWIDVAEQEHFITDRCKQLFSVSDHPDDLKKKLAEQSEIHIDLHKEKWGPSETSTHIEIKETE